MTQFTYKLTLNKFNELFETYVYSADEIKQTKYVLVQAFKEKTENKFPVSVEDVIVEEL